MRTSARLSLLIVALGLLPAAPGLAAGRKDPTFHPALRGVLYPQAFAAGTTALILNGNVVLRLRHDGSRDPRFGGDGDSPLPRKPRFAELALAPGGRLLASGCAPGINPQVHIVRLTTRGVIDRTFGRSGLLELNDCPAWWAVAPDGSLALLMGRRTGGLAVTRVTPSGRLDPRFGSFGTVRLGERLGYGSAGIVFDGSDVVFATTGTSEYRSTVYLGRLDRRGRPGAAFGPTGVKAVADGFARDLAVQRDHKILLSQWSAIGTRRLWRYLPDGRPDPGFGFRGAVALEASGFAPQRDGRIIAVGRTAFERSRTLRLLPDGSVDPSFSSSPVVDESDEDFVLGTFFQSSDGRLTIGGQTMTGGYRSDFTGPATLLRYLAGNASLRVREAGRQDNRLRLRVACTAPRGDRCRSLIRLSAVIRGRRVRVGARALTVSRGRSRTAEVALSSAARTRLRSGWPLTVRAETTTRDRVGYVDIGRISMLLGAG